MPSSGHAQFRYRRLRPGRTLGLSLLASAVTIILVVISHVVIDIHDTFLIMGLDPDRSQLGAALVVAAAVASCGALVGGRRDGPAVLGILAGAGIFGRTFLRETRASVDSTGLAGVFDLPGWIATIAALGLVAIGIGWAAAVIGSELRRVMMVAWGRPPTSTRSRSTAGPQVVRGVATVALVISMAWAFGVLSDLLNYAPDVLMRHGGPPPPPALTDSGSGAGAPAAGGPGLEPLPGHAFDPPSPGPESLTFGPGPISGSLITAGAWSSARPWAGASRSGGGSIVHLVFPAPWVGAGTAQMPIDVYLPAGYASEQVRYPVTYLVPWSFFAWEKSIHAVEQLDLLIAAGDIPAQIVVFTENTGAGPYPDSECVNSFDGRAWWDRYLIQTVIPAIDGQFRTRPEATFRSVIGLSEGGYCAAMILTRHPDLFAQEGSISGYFDAAPLSNQAANAGLVFGGNQDLLAAASPELAIRTMAPTIRKGLFFVLAADPSQPFYGPYFRAFGTELAHLGTPCALLPDRAGHSTDETLIAFGQILKLLAGHLAQVWT